MDLKSNKDFDAEFIRFQNKLLQVKTPDNFERIYDFSKRFINLYGFSVRAIELIYLLGYLDKENSI